MKYDIIQTDSYLIIIDDSEIKEGDLYIDDYNLLRKSITSDKDYWNSRKDYKKIIAHLPLNNSPILEGVDLLPPLEDKYLPSFESSFEDDYDYRFSKGFYFGYNKARETYKYTEEDLRKAIEMARKYPSDVAGFELNEIIQSLSQPKYPIAFEQGNIVDGKNYISVTRRHDDFTLWVGKYIY